MTRRFLILGLFLAALVNGLAAEPAPRRLVKANALPLALDDTFSFRKEKLFLNDPALLTATQNKMLSFERMRLNYGAVGSEELKERYGNYFTFWWRASRPAKVTVRLEYRQANLGASVQAQEIDIAAGKGTHKTDFQVTGDDYNHDGRVLAWRALVIENGRVVALTQSYLWQ